MHKSWHTISYWAGQLFKQFEYKFYEFKTEPYTTDNALLSELVTLSP